MMIALSIFGYFVLGFLWVFYSIAYAPNDVALSFYDGLGRDRIDHVWLLLNIFFWPVVMCIMVIWLTGRLLDKGFVRRLLDKRFGK